MTKKERTAHRMLSTLVKAISLKEKSSLFTPQLRLMANKCRAFLQNCPDAPVLHVENLSNWTGSDVPGAQGKTVGQQSEREMDEVWSKEARRAKRGCAIQWGLNVRRKGINVQRSMNKLVER